MDKYIQIDPDDLGRPDGFTGLWEILWPNGRPKYRGNFMNGIAIGQHVRYWIDGTVAHISWKDRDGGERGTAMSFYPDGDKDTEEIWDDISRNRGTFLRRCYDGNGDVFLIARYQDFEEVDGWQRPNERVVDEADIEIDGLIEDAIRRTNELARSQDEREDE